MFKYWSIAKAPTWIKPGDEVELILKPSRRHVVKGTSSKYMFYTHIYSYFAEHYQLVNN